MIEWLENLLERIEPTVMTFAAIFASAASIGASAVFVIGKALDILRGNSCSEK